jgi:hypothetical protein
LLERGETVNRTPKIALLWACAALLMLPLAGRAGIMPIGNVRVGLGASAETRGVYRVGAWLPVTVWPGKDDKEGEWITVPPEGITNAEIKLIVETDDQEGNPYRASVTGPRLPPTVCTVPVTAAGRFRILFQWGSHEKELKHLSPELLDPENILFLGLGPRLRSFKEVTDRVDAKELAARNAKKEDEAADPEIAWALPRRRTALALTVADLPAVWNGYDAADVLILPTRDKEFLEILLKDDTRLTALREWVRQGGQLVVSAGSNAEGAARLLDKIGPIDWKVADDPELHSLQLFPLEWCRLSHRQTLSNVRLARLTPGPATEVLSRENDIPLIVQTGCGLGRVVLVAFDVDEPEFVKWGGYPAFWHRLQSEMIPALKRRIVTTPTPTNTPNARPSGGADLRTDLRNDVESFDGVPVVSFAWVAILLILYIALVGPLDYILVRRVFKRPELTWITFPLTVLLVSVATYFSAYALKGDELRARKVDLVEIDLHSTGELYGRTWIGLFSPRPERYTLGLECAAPTWTPTTDSTPLLSLTEVLDRGLGRATQGSFAHPFEIGPAGLRGVPVPTWGARSFSATWQSPAPKPGSFTPIDIRNVREDAGKLSLSREGHRLVGRVTNNLDVELQGVGVLYGTGWYNLGTLAPGQSLRLETIPIRERKAWLDTNRLQPALPLAPLGRPVDLENRPLGSLMQRAMFYEALDLQVPANTGLLNLDQSWRLRLPTEAILIARLPLMTDTGENVAKSAVSPTRVWLGALPSESAQRPNLTGEWSQETFVRMFIPVESRPISPNK